MVSYAGKAVQQDSADSAASSASSTTPAPAPGGDADAIADSLVAKLFALQTGLFIRKVPRELDAYVRIYCTHARALLDGALGRGSVGGVYASFMPATLVPLMMHLANADWSDLARTLKSAFCGCCVCV